VGLALACLKRHYTAERFGRIAFDQDRVTNVDNDTSIWEREPVERLARDEQLRGYRHKGFWSCMDTLKEKNMLEELWDSGTAPWKIWD
jgi:NDP-sugar pyrophosphorylase family protein